ncbi:MAG: hypothetical protein IJ684_06955 [Bacteroidales bacterium]|nr:hypothetical protein [Alloprevotella sp.]MBR1644580.1 hypothetical protein [Bacteroidales bacterium]MBR1645090.1 hypothetical protein [Bacteroidales bacterium]
MKKILFWAASLVLVLGSSSLLTSCGDNDDALDEEITYAEITELFQGAWQGTPKDAGIVTRVVMALNADKTAQLETYVKKTLVALDAGTWSVTTDGDPREGILEITEENEDWTPDSEEPKTYVSLMEYKFLSKDKVKLTVYDAEEEDLTHTLTFTRIKNYKPAKPQDVVEMDY